MSVAREQYVVDSRGKRKGVILSNRQYKKLMEALHDLAVAVEQREKKSISLEALNRRLSKDGLLYYTLLNAICIHKKGMLAYECKSFRRIQDNSASLFLFGRNV